MANKKVFDVIPPQKGEELASSPKSKKESASFEKVQVLSKKTSALPQAKKGGKAIWVPVLILVFLILIAGAAYFLIKPKAELAVWPVKTPVQFKIQATVDSSLERIKDSIAGEIVSHQQSFSQEFPATGVKAKTVKAQGTIRVYNAYSTSPQTFIATTRFVSDDGKLFRTPVKVIIPGGHYEGGKLIPGEIDILVEAGEAGEEYNIGSSTFSIPGLVGTSHYTAFYAESFEPMTGGMKTEILEVTKEDLGKAANALENKALQECKKSLENSFSFQDYIVIEEAMEIEITEATPLAKEGQELSNFTFQAEAQAEALVFKKEDLEAFAQTHVLSQISEGEKLDQNSLAISYLPQEVDLEKGKIILDVEILAETYPLVNENAIKEEIANQKLVEAEAFLRKLSEIDRFQIRLWPFWTNKVPLDKESIDIKLKLD